MVCYMSLFLYQHNHLQAEVEEDDFGIAVLRNLPLRLVQFRNNFLHIASMDEGGEVPAEVLLLLHLVVQLRNLVVVDEVLAYLALHKLQERLLLFAPHLRVRHRQTPLAEFLQRLVVLPVSHHPRLTHQGDKVLHKKPVLLIVAGHPQRLMETALGKVGYVVGGFGVNASFCESLRYLLLRKRRHTNQLHAAQNGGKKSFGGFADKQENRLLWRLLQQLQEFVGTRGIHLFRLPDYHHLVARAERLERELAKYLAALFLIDDRLLVLYAQLVVPVVQREVTLVEYNLPEGVHEVVACVARIGLDNGKGEMEVRMLQLLKLQAGGTLAAGIVVGRIGTIEILRVRDSQLEFSDSLLAREQAGMRHTPLLHRKNQLALDLLLSYYITEPHKLNMPQKRAKINKFSDFHEKQRK